MATHGLSNRQLSPPTPEETVARAQKGDLAAFERLIRTYGNQVYGFLARWLSSTTAAEDVFQEACLRAYRSIHKARPKTFKAWFFRIAINEAKKHVRTVGRAHRRERAAAAEWKSDTNPSGDGRLHATTVLERGLREASADHRQVLLLRFVEQMSHQEIARTLGVPTFVIKMRVSRARAAFARVVQKLEATP